jgi:hypothetical protein
MNERSIRDPTILPYTSDSGERFGVKRACVWLAGAPAPLAFSAARTAVTIRENFTILLARVTPGGFGPRVRSFAHTGITALGVSLAPFVNTARSR